jgi:SAM-dependent methyltransferase
MNERKTDFTDADEQNLVLARSVDSGDQLPALFYERFPYPQQSTRFDYLTDQDFETAMLNQDIGDWSHRRIPEYPKIWVAGCGTSQAIVTALRFPKAVVLGSDVSARSLEICANYIEELGISNLEIVRSSINQAAYKSEFDYIICTGVIHHNTDPTFTLSKLATALKPDGILDLMVYNRYHKIASSAFQKAVRILSGGINSTDFDLDLELSIARRVADKFPTDNILGDYLSTRKGLPESLYADALINLVEHSFTVESLDRLTASCCLELLIPCVNAADDIRRTCLWNLKFGDEELQQRYDSLSDASRWQVSNLLLFEKSPSLWFYLQRSDCGKVRKSERQICEEFLDTVFFQTKMVQKSYVLSNNGRYISSPNVATYPVTPPDHSVREIYDSVDGKRSMRNIFHQLGIETAFPIVNQARIRLSTSTFPYIKAISHKN